MITDLSPDRCRQILLTTDGLGKARKTEALEVLAGPKSESDVIAKLQRQKFLLETRLQQLWEDRKKWKEGEDNPVLREEIADLKNQVKCLQTQNNGLMQQLAAYKNPLKPKILDLHNTVAGQNKTDLLVIEFDGGTSCNVPSRGYGKGYGSYKIANLPIKRMQFTEMSANAAEIFILAEALNAVEDKKRRLLVRGDSQIALQWCARASAGVKKEIGKKVSVEFKNAIAALYEAAKPFPAIFTEWRGRAHSLRIFGH